MHGSMSLSRSGENLGFSDIYSYLKPFSKYSPISFLLRSRTPLSNIISFIRFLLLQIMVDIKKKKEKEFRSPSCNHNSLDFCLHNSFSLSIHSSNSRHIAASISRFSFVGLSLCTSTRSDSNSLILVFVCPK